MMTKELYKDYSVHEWLDYAPSEPQYYNQSPNVVAAGFKIVDVYEQFSNARSCLGDMEVDNYGSLIEEHDDLHLSYIRNKFFLNALSLYNYCIDLSWQVVWLYYGTDDLSIILEESEYIKATKECDLFQLEYKLSLARKIKLKKHLLDFFQSKHTTFVREKYNYLKHRGAFQVSGLGMQYDHLAIGVNGRQHRMLTRETINLDDWKSQLIEFDLSFKKYFEAILLFIMPQDYLNQNYDFLAPLEYDRRIQDYYKNKQY